MSLLSRPDKSAREAHTPCLFSVRILWRAGSPARPTRRPPSSNTPARRTCSARPIEAPKATTAPARPRPARERDLRPGLVSSVSQKPERPSSLSLWSSCAPGARRQDAAPGYHEQPQRRAPTFPSLSAFIYLFRHRAFGALPGESKRIPTLVERGAGPCDSSSRISKSYSMIAENGAHTCARQFGRSDVMSRENELYTRAGHSHRGPSSLGNFLFLVVFVFESVSSSTPTLKIYVTVCTATHR